MIKKAKKGKKVTKVAKAKKITVNKLVQELSAGSSKLQQYELVVIFKPFLPDQVRTQGDQKITHTITTGGGQVLHKDVWGKRYLAYPIEAHNEGYYVVYHIQLPPGEAKEVTKHLQRTNDVLRYLMIRNDEGEVKARKPDK